MTWPEYKPPTLHSRTPISANWNSFQHPTLTQPLSPSMTASEFPSQSRQTVDFPRPTNFSRNTSPTTRTHSYNPSSAKQSLKSTTHQGLTHSNPSVLYTGTSASVQSPEV